MDKLKGTQQRSTGVMGAGVLTVIEKNGAGSAWTKDAFNALNRPHS